MRKNRIGAALVVISLFLFTGCGSLGNSSVKTDQNQTVSQTKETGDSIGKQEPDQETQAEKDQRQKELETVKQYGKLRVGCRTDVKELGYENPETKKLEGLEIELAYAVAARVFGVAPEKAEEQRLCEFLEVTAKEGISLLEAGQLDLVVSGVEAGKEQQERCRFSVPYLEEQAGMMCLSDSGFQTGENLDQAIIGVESGTDTVEALLAYLEEQALMGTAKIQEFDSSHALLSALKAGNIDLLFAGSSILKGYQEDGMTILPDPVCRKEYAAAVSKTAPALLEMTDEVIKEWRKK